MAILLIYLQDFFLIMNSEMIGQQNIVHGK